MNAANENKRDAGERFVEEFICQAGMETKPKTELAEGIRAWYAHKTSRAIRWLIGAGITATVAGAFLFVFLPEAVTLRLQLWNGAYTLPIGAFLWIVVFTLVWMVPLRETTFRTFESTEELREKLAAKGDRLEKLAARLEARLTDEFFDRFERALDDMAFKNEPLPVPPGFLGGNPGNGRPVAGPAELRLAKPGEFTVRAGGPGKLGLPAPEELEDGLETEIRGEEEK